MLGVDQAENKQVALVETLCFSFFGNVHQARDFALLRKALRRIMNVDREKVPPSSACKCVCG